MRQVDRLYDWLSQGPTPDCDRIFAAALRHAEPAWAERITRILLARQNEASWATLIGRYTQLPSEIRLQLRTDGNLMQAGVAQALRFASPDARMNALLALEEEPSARMAYVLPEAIRDPVSHVRIHAGKVWRKMVDAFLNRPLPGPDADKAFRAAYAAERHQLVLALDEALRTFDLHRRVEVLEMCLWLARDLGQTLWERLAARRSRVGATVAENLHSWNHPRLAHFLVSALRQSAWRDQAARVLRTWKTLGEVSAFLRESELLDDPKIRQNLTAVPSPCWFTEIDRSLHDLTPGLRPLVPRWVCHAGYRQAEKNALLSHWLRSKEPEIHKATVYALAEVEDDYARTLLTKVADSASPLASFARWCVSALDTETLRSELASGNVTFGPTATNVGDAFTSADTSDAHCQMVWKTCRRTSPDDRGGLIAMLRENADVWEPRLKRYLHSPDPRDRILALQVVSTEELALRFLPSFEPLLNDPVDGIRQLAHMLVRTLARQSSTPSLTQRERAAEQSSIEQAEQEDIRTRARRDLEKALDGLSAGSADPTDAELLARVGELLRQVYDEENGPRPLAAGKEELR